MLRERVAVEVLFVRKCLGSIILRRRGFDPRRMGTA
jgi:hypothetical protein